MERLFGWLTGFIATTIVAVLTTDSEPSGLLLLGLGIALFLAAIGWVVTRRMSRDHDEERGSEEAPPGASTSGDHSPAASASHSGTGDIRIDQSTHHHPAPDSPARRYRGERVLQKTAADLCGYYDSHTSLKADGLVETFIGKPLEVSGPVANVAAMKYGLRVHLDSPRPLFLSADFSTEWRDRLLELDKGDEVVIIGRIKEISGSSLVVEESQLIDD